MTDRFDYPRTKEIALGPARDQLQSEIEELEAEIVDLEERTGGENPDPVAEETLRNTRGEKRTLKNHRDGVQWAIDEWSEDATITLEALTTQSRGDAMDALRTGRMGDTSSETVKRYVHAQILVDAPFVESEDDIHDKAALLGRLPPAVSDWLGTEIDELNDLGN